jgi:hypothetical protein
MRVILTLLLLTILNFATIAQEKHQKAIPSQYAYISVEGKLFSKKLKVVVDLGDTQEQIDLGKKYSDILINRKSYAAILNFMVDEGFDLVETLTIEESSSYSGTGSGGTAGVIFIMKRGK